VNPAFHDSKTGWKLYQHPLFRDQLNALVAEAEVLARRLSAKDYSHHPKVRLLARVRKIILEDIPRDPGSPTFEQGNTLGSSYRHSRRAKFNQRFRIFFRFHTASQVIIYAWMNDESTLRARGSRRDVYATFERRLKAGEPPDDWDDLFAESRP
jgi:toxin YhaV